MANGQKVYGVIIPTGKDRFQGFAWNMAQIRQICFAVKSNSPIILEIWQKTENGDVKVLWSQGEKSLSLLFSSQLVQGTIYPIVHSGESSCTLLISPTLLDGSSTIYSSYEELEHAFSGI